MFQTLESNILRVFFLIRQLGKIIENQFTTSLLHRNLKKKILRSVFSKLCFNFILLLQCVVMGRCKVLAYWQTGPTGNP